MSRTEQLLQELQDCMTFRRGVLGAPVAVH